jgi:hypothetical protein
MGVRMRLKEIKYFKPLMWAIEKYCHCPLPNPEQRVSTHHNWYKDHENIENNINYLFVWDEMEEGSDYWSEIHALLDKEYNNELYFPDMVKDWKRNEKVQLELTLY